VTSIDPTTIAADYLGELLHEWAAGYYPDEAAVALLRHGCGGVWLRRRDFLTACVEVAADGWTTASPDGIDHLEAIAHRAGWHQHGITRTVTGHLAARTPGPAPAR